MTCVYGAQQYAEADGPMVHALIIGVGHYPHLPAGVVPNLPPLGDLASPPASARALADWFIDVLAPAGLEPEPPPNRNPRLGSVELLISESPAAGVPAGAAVYRGQAIDRATLDNITASFAAWFDRCNAHRSNIAFCHFCGHGLEAPLNLLLPEDFNRSRRNPWKDAIDFTATYRAMTNCVADNQFYVVDACREWTKDLLLVLSPKGVSLLQDNAELQHLRFAPVLFGAARSRPAYGDATGGPSELTRVLIECLNGAAAKKYKGNRFQVRLDRLGPAASLLVKYGNRSRPPDDSHDVDSTIGEAPSSVQPRDIFVLRDGDPPPKVRVVLGCDSYDASEQVIFCLHPTGTAPHANPNAPCQPPGGVLGTERPGDWDTTIDPDTYDLFARFVGNPPNFATVAIPRMSIEPPVWPDPPTDAAVEATPWTPPAAAAGTGGT